VIEPLILDGGMGSELRRRGVTLSALCWSAEANLTHGALITEIHRDFIAAGADIITTNTFATSRFVLAGAGLEEAWLKINEAALLAARMAVDTIERKVRIAGSISCLPPRFDVRAYPSADVEYGAYTELATTLARHGADLILLEMLQDPAHAELACRGAAAAGLPVWAGISARLAADADRPITFDPPHRPLDDVIAAVLPFEPHGIAIMHTPLDATEPALAEVRKRWSGPIAVYPELAYPEDPTAPATEPMPAEAYADSAKAWLELGATMIGGCCGTTPRHIRALSSRFRA